MNCEQAIHLISARIDHEILLDDRALLEMHLQDCEACRATADAFDLQHGELTDTFEPRRQAAALVAERVNAQLPDGALPASRDTPGSPPSFIARHSRFAAQLCPVVFSCHRGPHGGGRGFGARNRHSAAASYQEGLICRRQRGRQVGR
jgi:anti-sigma factor RsiW